MTSSVDNIFQGIGQGKGVQALLGRLKRSYLTSVTKCKSLCFCRKSDSYQGENTDNRYMFNQSMESVMQAAFSHLIKYVLKDGHTVSVWDGEEWQVKRSTSFKAIKEAVESVDEAALRIRDNDGNIIGWASVSVYGLQPEETVMDYGDNGYMNSWFECYEEYTAMYM